MNDHLELDTSLGFQKLTANFDVSSDGSQFLIIRRSPKSSYLLDLSTGEKTSYTIKPECLTASWSPNKKLIALSCLLGDASEIFILDTTTGQISQVTNCHDIYQYCSLASWSTNGNWLAYYQSDERSGEHPRGIMIFNKSCLATNNCMAEQMGPIPADSNPTWSLQNQLVYMQSGMISYVQVKNRQYNQVHANLVPELHGSGRSSESIKFSPDGNYLACLSINHDSIYLYTPAANDSQWIYSSETSIDLNLIGWIKIQ